VALDGYAEVVPFQPDLSPDYLERRYANDPSAFVDVGGARVHYRDEGPRDGPTLLALHGLYSSLHTWDDWMDDLTDRVRVVRMDLPGLGLTGPTAEGRYDMPSYVEVLEAFRSELGLGEVALAGNSLGGGVAWRFAARYPGYVRRLVLLDAVGRQVVPDEAEFLVQPRSASSHGISRRVRPFGRSCRTPTATRRSSCRPT